MLLREVELVLSVPLVLQYEAVLMRPGTLAAIAGSAERVGRLLDELCAVARPCEISALRTADYFRERAARARPEEVEALLASFGDDAPPLEGDEVA